MKIVSKHAQKRIEERLKENNSSKVKLFKSAIKSGNEKECYCGDFYKYLYGKSLKGQKIKVYNNNIFIMTRKGKILITVYPVPNRFIPTEQYLINKEKSIVYYNIHKFYNKEIKLLIDQKIKASGILKKIIGSSYAELIELQTYTGSIICIDTHHIDYIHNDIEHVNQELYVEMCM